MCIRDSAALGHQRRVAAELQRVAQALFGVQQDGLARQRFAAGPGGLGKVALALVHAQRFGLPAPFVAAPALFEVAASQVDQRGATVILEAKQPLTALLGTLAGVSRIVTKGEALPPFDYHIPLMSLPLAFGTRLDTVPAATPYLESDPAKVAQWQALLGPRTRPRVGVVWSGHPANPNDLNRSVPLAVFARLFGAPCEFISLQKDVKPAEQALLDAAPVRQLAGLLQDFSDTAALCELMDVVVTVDTSVAHLAGALGKPVWILLQTPFEWRWLEQGAGSPWYPDAVLYRQAQRGAWEPVMDAVAADLAGVGKERYQKRYRSV